MQAVFRQLKTQCEPAGGPNNAQGFGALHALILLVEYAGVQYVCSVAVYALTSGLSLALSPARLLAISVLAGIPLASLAVVVHCRVWAAAVLREGHARAIAWCRPRSPTAHGVALVAGIGWGAAAAWVMVNFPDRQTHGPLALLAAGDGFDQLVLVLLAVLWAPVIEEFLFRGAIFAAICRSFGTLAATLATTVLFVAMHWPDKGGYWPGLAAVAGVSLLGCGLRLRYRSLAPAVAAHIAYNGAVIVVAVVLSLAGGGQAITP